jgi:DNA-binding beta-propeller fold protein YncE
MRSDLVRPDSLASPCRVALLVALLSVAAGCDPKEEPPGAMPDAAPVCVPVPGAEPALPAGVRVVFPPARSLTDAATLTVRGTALLDGDVAAIRVNGVAARSTDGFRHWQATVPLTPGENTLAVESQDGAGQIDPAAAQATIVSAPHPMYQPAGVVLDAPRNRALVIDNMQSTVLAVDLATGLRTVVHEYPAAPFAVEGAAPVVSSVPGPLAFPLHDIELLDADVPRVVVAAYNQIFTLDVSTGERTVIASREAGSGPIIPTVLDIAVDAAGGRVLAVDFENESLMAVDLATGERSFVVDLVPGVEPVFTSVHGLVLDAGAGRVLVSRSRDFDTAEVVAVDLDTGEVARISGLGLGSGPELAQPDDMVLDEARGRVLIADSKHDAVIAVDLATGDRTFLWDATSPGRPVLGPTGLALDAQQGRALVVDDERRSLYAVDLETGQLTRISDDLAGSGPALRVPSAIAMDVAEGRVLIGDRGGSELVAVALATGERSVLSSDAAGEGPSLGAIFSVALDAQRQRVLAVDLEAQALLAVDLASGRRSALASAGDGRQPPLAEPRLVTIDEAGDQAVVSMRDGLVTVDLATGDRAMLAAGVRYSQWLGVQPECSRVLSVFSDDVRAVDLGSGRAAPVAGASCPLEGVSLEHLAYDARNVRILGWFNNGTSLWAMDTRTGECAELVDVALDAPGLPASSFRADMVMEPSTGLLFMATYANKALYVIDPETGERVIVSR